VSRARAALLASDTEVEELAQAELAANGSAVGAVVSGFFIAAGKHPGVLLSPVSLLIGGVGTGGRAFDGRSRQPGLAARRPRGILPGAPIPDAARVAAPTSIAALAVAVAYESNLSLPALIRPGIQAAERASANQRAAFLGRVAGFGPTAFAESTFSQAVLRRVGPSQGGLFSPSDFEPPDVIDVPANEDRLDDSRWFEVPWAEVPASSDSIPATPGHGHAIVAVDPHGRFAALAYRQNEVGLRLPELDLTAPFGAMPVMRGVPRTSPGQRLSSPAPLAIVWRDASDSVEVVAQPAAERFALGREPKESLSIRRDSRTRVVAARRYATL
jgi:hypothetical protein